MENRYTSNLAVDLGIIEYNECLELQHSLVKARKRNEIPNILLFLEHDPPVYTIGRKADPKNYPNIKVIKTERGGDVTYHSPGQMVIYPIFDLSENGRIDVRKFVKTVEQIVIDLLHSKGYNATVGDEPGIWVLPEKKKVASIGMAIDQKVSYHGAAINISQEPLSGFSMINPCGLSPEVMGYVEIDREYIVEKGIELFSKHFGRFERSGKQALLKLIGETNAHYSF